MGEVDTERQALNVARMRLLGAEVVAVTTGIAHPQGRDQRGPARLGHQRRATPTTSSAPSPARTRSPRWSATSSGSSATRRAAQVLELTGRLPDAVVACVGGGSNAMGIFHAFIDDADVALYGFEAGGEGVETGRHAATIRGQARRACCTARCSYLCRTTTARPSSRTRSRPASTTRASARSTPGCATSAGPSTATPPTTQAMEALPAALPHRGHHPGASSPPTPSPARSRSAASSARTPLILVNLSGRGDKDMHTAAEWFGLIDERRDARAAPPTSRAPRATEGPSCERHDHGHRGRQVLEQCRAENRAALVGYLPGRLPVRRGLASRRWSPWSRPASTSSRSASPTATR